MLVARANPTAPLPPPFDGFWAQKLSPVLARDSVVLDSATAPSLKGRLGGPKRIKRIVVVTYSGSASVNGTTFVFSEAEDPVGYYEIALSLARR